MRRADDGSTQECSVLAMTYRVYPTRGLSREEAAAYIGIGSTKFDEMVADGRMPQPRVIDGRVVWCVHELDEFFDRLPRRGDTAPNRKTTDDDPWSRQAA